VFNRVFFSDLDPLVGTVASFGTLAACCLLTAGCVLALGETSANDLAAAPDSHDRDVWVTHPGTGRSGQRVATRSSPATSPSMASISAQSSAPVE
jgi:hypothetical protein